METKVFRVVPDTGSCIQAAALSVGTLNDPPNHMYRLCAIRLALTIRLGSYSCWACFTRTFA